MKWNVVPLGTVCSVSSSKRIFAKEYQTEGIPFYRGKEIIEKHHGNPVSTELFISKDRYEEIRSKFDVPQVGDILLTSVGTLGVSWLVDETGFYFKDGNLTWLRAKEGLLNKYLYLWLNSTDAKHQIDKMCIGSTQKALTIETINKFLIPLPTVQEQEDICSVVYPIMERIKVNRSINDNLQQQAQAIYREMFISMSATTPATIADVSLNVTDGVHNTVHDDPAGKYLLLSCKNIKGSRLSIGASERTISRDTFDKLRRRTRLAKGDVLISSVGTVGEVLLLNADPTNYEFQRSVAIIKPNPEIISSYYLYEALIYQKAELINAAHGAVQQCLFISDIAGFPMGIPDPEALSNFNAIVAPIFDAITANESECDTLCSLRDNLLPRLMSGEIDVSAVQL